MADSPLSIVVTSLVTEKAEEAEEGLVNSCRAVKQAF